LGRRLPIRRFGGDVGEARGFLLTVKGSHNWEENNGKGVSFSREGERTRLSYSYDVWKRTTSVVAGRERYRYDVLTVGRVQYERSRHRNKLQLKGLTVDTPATL
jgi:hypothetical protein